MSNDSATANAWIEVTPSAGDGTPLLLLNSLGTTNEMWAEIVAPLAVDRPVVRYEYPGHGGRPHTDGQIVMSDLVDQTFDVMDLLSIGAAHLAGISIGGMVAIHAAAQRPDRVASLSVLCSSPRLPRRAWLERAEVVRESGLSALSELIADRWFTKSFQASHPLVVQSHLEMLRSTDPKAYAQLCELLAAADVRGDLARVTAPTLVIAGSDDFASPLADVECIATGIPEARLDILDGVSHMAVAAAGAQVTTAIADHISIHSRREGARPS